VTDPYLVSVGEVSEDDVARFLMDLGWTVALYGSRLATSTPRILAALRSSRYPIRHAPDLIAARRDRGVCLVEVIHCDPARHDNRSLELSKLEALTRWSAIAPVAVVDTGDWLAWWHHPGWAAECVSDALTRTRTGSGDPFAWFPRKGSPAAELFR
jgi:hypothetical protein